jgi:hypothetical protein
MDFFYYHLVELHTNIYILEKILPYPLWPFRWPRSNLFPTGYCQFL